jgi:3-oxoacyl-[acyl-carrier protein] reductase
MNILITGGASGLGAAITRTLAKNENHFVYFTYSSSNVNAQKIENELRNTQSIKCDFRSNSDLNQLINKLDHLDIDVLINNAYHGSYLTSHFHKIESDEFLLNFKTNIIPTIEITQKVISKFRKKKSGKIITILTSALLNHPPKGSSVYVATKAYLEKLTKVWATENAQYNIVSNSISPSFMQTELTSTIDERIVEQIEKNHPLKKLLTVHEVAETVLFMVNSTSQINGVDIAINSAENIK